MAATPSTEQTAAANDDMFSVCFPELNNFSLFTVAHLFRSDFCFEFSKEQVHSFHLIHQWAALADSQFIGVSLESYLEARKKCLPCLDIIDRAIPSDMIRALNKIFPNGAKYLNFLFHLNYCITQTLVQSFPARKMPSCILIPSPYITKKKSCCYLATPLPFARKCQVAPYEGMYNKCLYCDRSKRSRLIANLQPHFYLIHDLLGISFILKHQVPTDIILHILSQMHFIVSFQNLLLSWAEHYGFVIQEGTTMIIRGDTQQISAVDLFMKWLTYFVRIVEKLVCNSKGGVQLHLRLCCGKKTFSTECDKPDRLPWRIINSLSSIMNDTIQLVDNSRIHVSVHDLRF